MRQVLIYKHIIKNGEYDICSSINYQLLNTTVEKEYSGISPNWANRLWLQGLLSTVQCKENNYIFLSDDMTPDYINHNFDFIILPMANIFWVGYRKQISDLAEIFEQIKIPTYVIACGVQADSYDDLDTVINQLKEPASRFIKAIYDTGGEFALRGYFTKEFFNKLGFRTAEVTGCPSLYQNGRRLAICTDSKVQEIDFRPALNGCIDGICNYITQYPQAEFFDQCNYFELVFSEKAWSGNVRKSSVRLIDKNGYDPVDLAAKGKMNLFPDMNDWRNYLQSQGFHFSYGSRIHGNIISILSGVPAIVWARDSRTREMSEFYDIPYTLTPVSDLYKAFQEVDYSKFNDNYLQHYEAFERFLMMHNIVDRINEENIYWNDSCSLEQYNAVKIKVDSEYSEYLGKNKATINAQVKISRTVHKVLDRLN